MEKSQEQYQPSKEIKKTEKQAHKIQKKIESGEVKDYSEAEKQLMAEKEFENFLKGVHPEKAIEIQSKHNLSEDFVKTAAQEALLKHLSQGNFQTCFSIENNFKVSPGEFSDQGQIRLAAIKGIKASFAPGRVGFTRAFGTVEEVKKRYDISEEILQSIARETMLENLLKGDFVYGSVGIAKDLELPNEVLQSAVVEAIEIKLKENNVSGARELKDEFNVSEEIINSIDKGGQIAELEAMEKEVRDKKAQKNAEIRDKRKQMETQLTKMEPLFNEKEYKEIDPDGLLKNRYDNDLKQYIDKDNKLILPDFFAAAHNAPRQYKWRRDKYKEIPGKTVSLVYNFAQEMAYNSIYFENNREVARQVLIEAFQALNNSKQIHNLTGEKNFWFELETVSGFACVCNISEHLGRTANSLGFPDLADYFKKGTYCPEGPQFPRPAMIESRNMDVTDYDKKYDKEHGYSMVYEKYSPEENKENIESMKRMILRHIKKEISLLKNQQINSKE